MYSRPGLSRRSCLNPSGYESTEPRTFNNSCHYPIPKGSMYTASRPRSAISRDDQNSRIVRMNYSVETSIETAIGPARPRITNAIPFGALELRHLRPREARGHLYLAHVQHQHQGALLEPARPELGRVGGVERPVGIRAPPERHGGLANGVVLVEGQQVLVLEDGEAGWLDLGQVGADEEGRLHGGPEGEVGALFGGGEAAVADFEHVGVRVPPEIDVVHGEGVSVQEIEDAVPSVCGETSVHAPLEK